MYQDQVNLAVARANAITYVDSFVASNPGFGPENSAFPNIKINFISDFIEILKKRIKTPSLTQQGDAGLCGVASFSFCKTSP